MCARAKKNAKLFHWQLGKYTAQKGEVNGFKHLSHFNDRSQVKSSVQTWLNCQLLPVKSH